MPLQGIRVDEGSAMAVQPRPPMDEHACGVPWRVPRHCHGTVMAEPWLAECHGNAIALA